jgi:DNA-binding GntR family transcriptional regulator
MNETESNATPAEKRPAPSWAAIGSSHKSLNDAVTDALRQAILHGKFEPGERLTEVRLAEIFKVSRNPVREALRVLQVEGTVEIIPRKGARVPLLSLEEIEEIIELRAELEGMSAKYAAKRCTEETRNFLQALLDDGNKAAEQGNLDVLQDFNIKFHSSFAEMGKNRFLASFTKSLNEKTQWLFANRSEQRVAENWQEHAAILKAVISADAELSSVLAMRHVEELGKEITKRASASDETESAN